MKNFGAICLATHNGEQFLATQLQALRAQREQNWHLFVSDDGSTDGTLQILERFRAELPNKVTLLTGPNKGFAANFIYLLQQVPDNCSWLAFADQDDYWRPGKLSRALPGIDATSGPAMYCGRRISGDTWFSAFASERRLRLQPSFQNALVENIAPGNTIVMNRAAINLLKKSDASGIAYHDWWAYQLITGAGGHVIYDPVCQLLYRQHGTNITGSRVGLASKWKRLKRLYRRRYSVELNQHLKALHRNSDMLSKDALKLLNNWQATISQPDLHKSTHLSVRRQSRFGQIGLATACYLGWLQRPKVPGKPLSICKAASEDT